MEQFKKHFEKIYVDMAAYYTDIETLKFAVTKIGAKRILFGTDLPAGRITDPQEVKRHIQNIKKLDLSEKDVQLILEGNAATLLKL